MSLVFCVLGVTATLLGLRRAKWFDIAAAVFHFAAIIMKLSELSSSFVVWGCCFVVAEVFTIFCCGMNVALKIQQDRRKKDIKELETRLADIRKRAQGEREPAPLVCGGTGSGKNRYYVSPDANRIVRFLLGEPVVVNNKPLSINEIWGYSYPQLEYEHNYIQWLFPLEEASDHNPNAPILTADDVQVITQNPKIRYNLLRSLELMLDFYGFRLDKESTTIKQKDPKAWPPTYHNYLRITRILKSLTICGLREYAVAFYNALLAVPDIQIDVPKTSLDYWQQAVSK